MLTRPAPRHAAAASIIAALLVTGWAAAPPAAATGEGGARSQVIGRGNIVTTILGWSVGTRRRSTSAVPRCRWSTLTDAQLEFLLAASPELADAGIATPWVEPLRRLATTDALPDGDVQVRSCDGVPVDARFVAPSSPRTDVQVLTRQMITQLPAPEPLFSPPGAAAVPVGEPVFVAVDRSDWRTIEGTLVANGLTAQVRARPVSMRVITGDPASENAYCDGPGQRFDPTEAASVGRQARRSGTCVIRYHAPSDEGWLGTVTVLWSAQWRVGAGDWNDLGLIPRTRVVNRVARELTTSIESLE